MSEKFLNHFVDVNFVMKNMHAIMYAICQTIKPNP